MSFKETEVGRIPIDWEVDELSNKVDLVMGQSPKSEFYNDKGIGMPFMQGRTTFGEKYHYINTWCTDIKRVGIKNSVLMSVRAPVGDVNIATEDICIGRGLASLNMKNKNNEFLYYLLKNYSGLLISKESGTVFGSINKAGIEKLVLPFPSKSEQKAIAKILSDLDEKVEINNKINKNLEEMAQAIFKQWFVDFEFPNEEGKPYKSSGGEMVESELGMIPKGFKISELKEIADDIITGKTPSTKNKENYGEKYPFITIPDMHNSIFINSSERYLSEKGSETQKSKLLPKNSIIVSCIATVGLVSITTKESHINQQINAVIIDKIEYLYYLYEAIKRKKELLLAIGSSGSATLNVNKKEFEKIKYLNPTNYYVNLFNSKVNILYEKIKANILENERLEKLRDTLLPKLMSGEIRVPLENNEN
ncbi:restriction endonuclease subunit S [Clostridium perfringens]